MSLIDEQIIKYQKIAKSKFISLRELTYNGAIYTKEVDAEHKHLYIITINQCNLNCTFCRGGINEGILKEQSKVKIMNYSTFTQIIDKCTEHGVRSFDLTPVIGELFLDKDLFSKLDFLENNPLIDRFVVTTNFTIMNRENLIKLSKYKKIFFTIPIYGYDSLTYAGNTNKDKYDVFIKNLELLYDVSKTNKLKSVYFAIRTQQESIDTLLYAAIVRFCLEFGYKVMIHETSNRNRAGHVSSTEVVTSRTGVCPYGPAIGGGIDQYGNVLYCPFNDISKKGIVGNIFTSSLSEIYAGPAWKNIINGHMRGDYTVGICGGCNETW
jgi:MoaA/NifB/PqqE/SkfB family radical SAM enzyme